MNSSSSNVASSVALGLMSGTSMDGVDVCAFRIHEDNSEDIEILGFLTHPFPPGLKKALIEVCGAGGVRDVCCYNVLLGKLFAEAAIAAMEEWSLQKSDISVIGSHGQTIYHQSDPVELFGYTVTSTLQIGDPSVIASEVGVTTVGDFRLADMAAGGQGAPLVPYLDSLLIKRERRRSGRQPVLLNIGGISNISAMNRSGNMLGFDCGPGNVLIDYLMEELYGLTQDQDGATAAKGKISQDMLDWLLTEDCFIGRSPPKSTGREYYNKEYVQKILLRKKQLKLSSEDCISTVTAFTAEAVWRNFDSYIKDVVGGLDTPEAPVFLCASGGGVHNLQLMKNIRDIFQPIPVQTTTDLGVPPDSKEALCFAVLAYETLHGVPTNLPSVTGAQRRVILGKICPV